MVQFLGPETDIMGEGNFMYPLNMVGGKDCDQYQLEEVDLILDTVKWERNRLMNKSLRFSWAYYYTDSDICFSMRDDGQQQDREQTK